MRNYLLLTIILICSTVLPANDNYHSAGLKPVETYGFSGERFTSNLNSRSNELPDSILIFLVEFEDAKFDTVPDFPDFLAHDRAYFHRLIFHLSTYWSDASYGNYKIVDNEDSHYVIHEEIITLPNTMSYYGEESDKSDMIERKVEMISDLLNIVDSSVDFNDYDTFMLFHAGAGQEAHSEVPELIQSTFLSRKSFQAALDPENDEFPGILTEDGTYFSEITIFPESENLADMNEEDGEAIYGLLGIIAQGFGYQLGLPSLFDNVNSNGYSFGIGSFGVMGYGVWNAAGYVPPLPCAWSRYFMGWEADHLIGVNTDQELLGVAYPQYDEAAARLYKISITEREYFLIENRQQNPDGSYFVNANNDTLVTFTFPTIEDQEVYEPGHPFAGEPRFMFMENSYEGCEWDFYLPGYGFGDDPELDGSGILIWHIDENIIEANFSANFNNNSVNGDAAHKGVDLEEADGIQHMDSINEFALGSKDDSYRDGNNTYFGKMYPEPGVLSLPTSESYYGGSQIEVYDISSSDHIMTFGVRFGWYLDSDYTGENPYNAAVVNFDDEDDLEIFYPMPDGSIYIWKNYILIDDYPLFFHPLAAYYAYDKFSQTFIIPTYNAEQSLSRACFLNNENLIYPPFVGLTWAGNPVVNSNEDSPYRALLPFHEIESQNSVIKLYDSFLEEIDEIAFENELIASNLMLKNDVLYSITSNSSSQFEFKITDLNSLNTASVPLSDMGGEAVIEASIMADVDRDDLDELIITTTDTLLYLYGQDGVLRSGFPVKIPLVSTSLPAVADVDGNGYLDVIIGGLNNFAVIDKNGDISRSHLGIESPDSLYSAPGLLALDIDGDQQLELAGCMSMNRFTAWENLNNNTFGMKRGYPVSLGDFCANYPIPVNVDDTNSTIYFASDNGTMYKHDLPVALPEIVWQSEYADLQRTACYNGELPENTFASSSVFLKDQTYVYPNPLSVIFNSSIFNGNLREQTLTVKIMTGIDAQVKLRVFDIAGNLVLTDKTYCEAYIDNCILIKADKLSSGIYFANLYSRGEVLKLKFAIEK
jgi:M6 family metalloprotease-like protein